MVENWYFDIPVYCNTKITGLFNYKPGLAIEPQLFSWFIMFVNITWPVLGNKNSISYFQ